MNKKILLALMPYWDPLIPPMGIGCLKSYLEPEGFRIEVLDVNVELRFQEIRDRYFDTLKTWVPDKKQSNLYNIGTQVLSRHMMAHLNHMLSEHQDTFFYLRAVIEIVFRTFFTQITTEQANLLVDWMETFYSRLKEYVDEMLERVKPDVLGLSVYNVTLPASLYTFRLTKEKNPQIQTVIGGGLFSGELDIHSANFSKFVESTPYIDKIIVGEGEELFLRFLQGKLPQEKRVYTLADIGNSVLDLEKAPIPDISGFDLLFYPLLASYTSRSCPFNCSFCSEKVLWGGYRKKKASQIVGELDHLSRTHSCQLFLMADSLLNPVADDLADRMIESGLSIYWDGYLRADKAVCDTDRTFKWRQGGFYRARLGLESGSPHILEAMGKKITPQQIKEAVSSLAFAGIKTTTYWVIGHPGETEEDFQQTLALIEEMKDDIYEADCNPFIYSLTGQVESDNWSHEKSRLLYSEEFRGLIWPDAWILDVPPFREETYDRLGRFTEHCRSLGIPNPYNLREINDADARWSSLHPNSVPPLRDFIDARNSKKLSIDENKRVKKAVLGHTGSTNASDALDDWGF